MTNTWQFVFFNEKSLPSTERKLSIFYRNCLLSGLVPINNVSVAPKELLKSFVGTDTIYTHFIILTNIENSNNDTQKTPYSAHKGLLHVVK